MIERISLQDDKVDILSHPSRQNIIHILSLDPILANDVYERLHNDKRMKFYRIVKPRKTDIRQAVEEIEDMALLSKRLVTIRLSAASSRDAARLASLARVDSAMPARNAQLRRMSMRT